MQRQRLSYDLGTCGKFCVLFPLRREHELVKDSIPTVKKLIELDLLSFPQMYLITNYFFMGDLYTHRTSVPWNAFWGWDPTSCPSLPPLSLKHVPSHLQLSEGCSDSWFSLAQHPRWRSHPVSEAWLLLMSSSQLQKIKGQHSSHLLF